MIDKYKELITLQDQLADELKKIPSKQDKVAIEILKSQTIEIKEQASDRALFDTYSMDELLDTRAKCAKFLASLQPNGTSPKGEAEYDVMMDRYYWYVVSYAIETRQNLGEKSDED